MYVANMRPAGAKALRGGAGCSDLSKRL